jgi:hypothetical protein
MVESPSRGSELPDILWQLCLLSTRTIPAAGASVTLASSAGVTQLLCSTDQISASLADLPFAIGEGALPSGTDARTRCAHQQLRPSQRGVEARRRTHPRAARGGAYGGRGSLFAFPLKVGAVHQATGTLMVQLAVPIDVAFARLRAHAYAEGASIMETASAVVARTLRLDREHDYPGAGGGEGHGNG